MAQKLVDSIASALPDRDRVLADLVPASDYEGEVFAWPPRTSTGNRYRHGASTGEDRRQQPGVRTAEGNQDQGGPAAQAGRSGTRQHQLRWPAVQVNLPWREPGGPPGDRPTAGDNP